MSDTTQHTPVRASAQAAASPGSSSVGNAGGSSAPTSPAQPHKASEMTPTDEGTKAAAEKEAVKKEVVIEGWSGEHEWFCGHAAGLVDRFGGRGDWVTVVDELRIIHDKTVWFDYGSPAREGLLVPLILIGAGAKGIDPTMVCLRTSNVVLRLPIVATSLKLALAFNKKDYQTYYHSADTLTHLLRACRHPIDDTQSVWPGQMMQYIQSLTVMFKSHVIQRIGQAYSTIHHNQLLSMVGITNLDEQRDDLQTLERVITRNRWQVDREAKLIRIVKARPIERAVAPLEYLYVAQQVERLESNI